MVRPKWMGRRASVLLLLAIVAIAAAGCAGGGQDVQEVTIGAGPPFVTAEVPGRIVKTILEEHGYDVELVYGDIGFTFAGVAKGDIDIMMDAWVPNQNHFLNRYGEIEKVAISYPGAKPGLYVPTYMEDVNTVADLMGQEARFDGTIYGPGEGTALSDNIKRFLSDHPEFEYEILDSSEAALMIEVLDALRDHEDIVFGLWRPHTLFTKGDFKYLTGYEDDYFRGDTVWAAAHPSVKERLPEVYAFLKNWSIDLSNLEELMLKVDENADEVEEVIQQWVDAHRDRYEPMWPDN